MHRVPVLCRSGFSRVVRWLCGRGWPVVLLLAAGCARKIQLADGLLATNASRELLVSIQDESLVLRRGDTEHLIPFQRLGCADRKALYAADVFHVSPDGNQVLVYSTHSKMGGFDLFGHAGRSLGATCLFDLVNEKSTPLEQLVPPESYLQQTRRGTLRVHAGGTTHRVYAWFEDDPRYPLEVLDLASHQRVELPLPIENGQCTVLETREELLVACADTVYEKGQFSQARILRYGLDSWPPAERSRSTLTLETGGYGTVLSLSPDGRFLAYKGEEAHPRPEAVQPDMLGIRELATGQQLLLLPYPEVSHAPVIEFLRDGSGVVIADTYKVDPLFGPERNRVRHYRLGGSLVATWEFSDVPYGLIAPPSGQGFWYVSYGEARWVPWK